MANNLGMVRLQQGFGQMPFYCNSCRLLQREQHSTSFRATYTPKKYILPSHKEKATPRFFARLVSIWLFQQHVLHQKSFLKSSKPTKYRMEAG